MIYQKILEDGYKARAEEICQKLVEASIQLKSSVIIKSLDGDVEDPEVIAKVKKWAEEQGMSITVRAEANLKGEVSTRFGIQA